MRLQVEMVQTGLSSCRDEKEFDSVLDCFPQPKPNAGYDLDRDLLNLPAVRGLSCRLALADLSSSDHDVLFEPTIGLFKMRDIRA